MKILIAEDDQTNFHIMEIYLKQDKHDITWAKNGQEAVDFINNTFDVVLMDIKMPILDGIEATKLIRRKNFIKPIIAQTAYQLTELELREAGFTHYINKPINFTKLLRLLKSMDKKH